jgi:O-antigen ligase
MKRLFIRYGINLSTEEWVWFFIWFTLPLSIRFNSLSILIGGIVLLVSYIRSQDKNKRKPIFHLFFPIAFFGIHAYDVVRNFNGYQSWIELEQMLPLLVIPLFFYLSSIKQTSFTRISNSALAMAVCFAGIVMLGESIYSILLNNSSIYSLTYHELIKPFSSGAIYFSFFLLIVLLQVDDISFISKRILFKYIVVSFLLLLLFLSASKLFIGIGIPMLILKYRHDLINLFYRRKIIIPFILILTIIISIPFGMRIKEVLSPRLDIVNADYYFYDTPLNGLNLRLIQARFGIDIIKENDAWLSGVGINDAQNCLNNKYIEHGIYTGYHGTNDTGYLNYNFHNQFIESFVRTGIPGLLLLIVMLIKVIWIPKANRFVSNWVVFLIFMFFLTESVLERQQGIVYFCLIYSSYFNSHQNITTINES